MRGAINAVRRLVTWQTYWGLLIPAWCMFCYVEGFPQSFIAGLQPWETAAIILFPFAWAIPPVAVSAIWKLHRLRQCGHTVSVGSIFAYFGMVDDDEELDNVSEQENISAEMSSGDENVKARPYCLITLKDDASAAIAWHADYIYVPRSGDAVCPLPLYPGFYAITNSENNASENVFWKFLYEGSRPASVYCGDILLVKDNEITDVFEELHKVGSFGKVSPYRLLDGSDLVAIYEKLFVPAGVLPVECHSELSEAMDGS